MRDGAAGKCLLSQAVSHCRKTIAPQNGGQKYARGIASPPASDVNANTPGKKYADGGGLWLAVRKTGTRHWLFRYQRDGIARAMGMGSLRSNPVWRPGLIRSTTALVPPASPHKPPPN